MKHRPFVAFVALVVAAMACKVPSRQVASPEPSPTVWVAPAMETPTAESPADESATPTAAPTAAPAPVVDVPDDVRGPGFSAYSDILVALPDLYEGSSLPVDLAGLANYDSLGFSSAQSALLAQNGFVVSPADWLEFYQVYEESRYLDIPVFVTTDSVFHVYHLLFDKMLRDLERDHFEPDIRELTAECLQSAQDLYAGMQGTDLEDVARRVVAYFAVADALINPDSVTPAEVSDLVAGELALIEGHSGLLASPIFSQGCPEACDPCDPNPPAECMGQPCMCEDYSQYVPRGHYARSEQLERYFRTMMWYGRINMRLQYPDETSMALLITHILRNTTVDEVPATQVWARVYEPTAFIVGKADDLGYHEYGGLWDVVFGPDAPANAISDPNKYTAFVETARQLPPPQVNSMWVYIWEDKEQVTQGFRFMGQRFTLDAYVIGQLTWREVGTLSNPRMLPKGLDVMAALGSDEAYALLEDMGETSYENYPQQMEKLRGEFGGLGLDSWTQNLYWSWLYSFEPLLTEKGLQYPAFMQTQAWAHKDIQTALGSWTELKHDTILYAKQSMAEMGAGEPPEPPHGWVEPNPEAYARLLALTRMTQDGLESRGLLTENTAASLLRLDDLLAFLLDVSQRELNGETLSKNDYLRIQYYGGELEALTLSAADADGDGSPFFEEDQAAALVADVATDPNGIYLEEAIGAVAEIFVVVPDGYGSQHIAKGGVFSYYEFPSRDRLTDEAWRELLASQDAPEQPEWTTSFISP